MSGFAVLVPLVGLEAPITAVGGSLGGRVGLSLALGGLGVLFLFAARPLARVLASALWRGTGDPGALAHFLRIAGMILLLGAGLAWPHDPRTAAFPPPPDRIPSESRS